MGSAEDDAACCCLPSLPLHRYHMSAAALQEGALYTCERRQRRQSTRMAAGGMAAQPHSSTRSPNSCSCKGNVPAKSVGQGGQGSRPTGRRSWRVACGKALPPRARAWPPRFLPPSTGVFDSIRGPPGMAAGGQQGGRGRWGPPGAGGELCQRQGGATAAATAQHWTATPWLGNSLEAAAGAALFRRCSCMPAQQWRHALAGSKPHPAPADGASASHCGFTCAHAPVAPGARKSGPHLQAE